VPVSVTVLKQVPLDEPVDTVTMLPFLHLMLVVAAREGLMAPVTISSAIASVTVKMTDLFIELSCLCRTDHSAIDGEFGAKARAAKVKKLTPVK
jgi:hypothetical protein